MSEDKLRIVWIDDNPKRREDYRKEIEEQCEAKVVCPTIETDDLSREVQNVLQGDEPDLVLLDHVLDKARWDDDESLKIRHGSTVASLLRETWPSCPIVGVTAADNVGNSQIELQAPKTYQYDRLISAEELSVNIHSLSGIISGFKALRKHEKQGLDSLAAEIGLDCNDEQDAVIWRLVKRSLPLAATTDLERPQYPSRFHHWFRETFHSVPGFLYDQLWTETLLGIKKGCLSRCEKRLSPALYGGIFDDSEAPRWWKHHLTQLVNEHSDGSNIRSQDIACQWLQVPEDQQSACHSSKKKWPDFVAYVDESENAERIQVFRRYTLAHPRRRHEVFYEEPRIVEGDDE